ncbi:MAG TPA: SBBP repeat-containing protein [Candidatus Dormibacteraeota bacterium]|nr:SBBP repeat-containing protein [Candidatus Dormibacteraeota bacterium]
MKRISLGILFFSFVILAAVRPASTQERKPHIAPAQPTSSAETAPATRARVLRQYANLPLRFEVNQGQTDGSVRFLSRGSGYTLFLTPTAAVLSTSETDPQPRNAVSQKAHEPNVLWMELLGAKSGTQISGGDELPGRSNYFIGNDPKGWHVGVPAFGRVRYQDIYPGIDLVYYGNQRHLEYDFMVAAGANPNAIRLNIRGSRHIRIDNNGDLVIRVARGKELRMGAPKVYQEEGSTRHSVDGKWVRAGRQEIRFAVGSYDRNKTLIVDPTLSLVYSTYLGGSSKDGANAVALDSGGDAYITGFTGSTNFPIAGNAFQSTCGGCTGSGTNNAFISELDSTGANLVYSTYLGGNNGDSANGIAVDANNNAYVVGTTFSSNFPVLNAVQPTCAGGCTSGDAFVAEINSLGSALVFSTYLGGSGGETGNAIALDSQGTVLVAGSTSSTDFPTHNPFQAANGGGTDAFVAEYSASGVAVIYSTYLGGSQKDVANAIAVDPSGNAYLAGETLSSNFPTKNPLQSANGGAGDAFVTELNNSGSALVYSTYLGGSALDSASGIALDSSNNAYVVGNTSSTNFPTQAPFQPTCASCSAGTSDAFITKINSSGSALVYSSFLGGSASDQANSVTVDAANNAFIVGQTSSTDFPVANSNYEFQATCKSCATGGHDVFIAEIDQAGDAPIFSTYLGGSTNQSALGVVVNSSEQAILAGNTTSTDFPTQGAEQGTLGGGQDAFITAYPAAASCTTTKDWSAGGTTLTATITCNGLFLPSNVDQFLGFVWGDGNTSGSGSGGGSNCALPPGTCTFSASNTYATGSYSGSQTVTDASRANIITTGFSVTIPAITIQNTSLSGGTVSTPYSQQLVAANGTTPYTWSLSAGVLPAGLTLNASTGVISGTPTTKGTSNFTVQVADSQANTTTQALSITISDLAPSITTQPQSQTINSGQTATMTVVASGSGTLTYQWYVGTSGVTTNPISGATASSYTTPALTATTSYWVRVTNSAGHADSNTATITVNTAPTITTQPQSQTINSGQTATMTVVASGSGTLTYQWYVGSSGNTSTPISGATASSYTTPALTATTSYWVRVTNSVGHADSNTATITVTIAPTITTQPQSQTINSGQTATMTVVASGSGTLTYQWYVGTSGVTTNPISGATASSYTTPALTATTSYWVRVSNSAGHADSNTATITVTTGPTITTQPQSQTINSGQTATMTVVASGSGTLTYQWYAGTSGVTTNPISGATASSYTTPALTATTSYWVQVTNSAGHADSNTATITVTTAPSITTQPQSQTINSGQTATMTVVASGSGTLTYQWYVGTSGVTANPISGATASSYTTPALTATTSYWVRVANSAGHADSNTTTITVNTLTGPTCLPPTVSVQTAANPLSVTATSNCTDSQSTITSTTINWGDDSSSSSGTSASHTYILVAGATSGTFTITVTATDANNLSGSASQDVTVTAPVSNPVTQGGAAQQTVNVTAPPGVSSVQVTYQCVSADGPSGVQPLNFYKLSCNINSQGSTATVTLTSTPTPVTVAVQTARNGAQQAELRRPRVGELYAAFLFLPGIVFLGMGCSTGGRRRLGRYTGLLLLALMMISWLGCGGGTITQPPPQNGTPSGSYTVGVTGTSSTGGSTSTITIGFTVTIGG